MNNGEGAAADSLEVVADSNAEFATILTTEALAFVALLTRRFAPRIKELLASRAERQRAFDAGQMPDFLPETEDVRGSDWSVGEIPADLADRRVEITGPTDRKMIINALNSGAKVFMADCEDSLTPTWDNVVRGQINLRDAVNREIEFEAGDKIYRLNDQTATLMVRPRGWHLPEKHLVLDGQAVPGALVDFGLYLFHNAAALKAKGTGPYFYLPKLESHLEARLWSDVFRLAEAEGVVSAAAIKVTVLIETFPAAFEMDEILYELRDYAVGLNCGRWDYIFSFIKTFSRDPEFVLPDRASVTMASHFLRSYSELLIRTCHRRGAYAMGGMAAQIPIKNDPEANHVALSRVQADKEREVRNGHDGTWVAHPALVPIAMAVFDQRMPGPNQLDRLRTDVHVSAADLLQVVKGRITDRGIRDNIGVTIRYVAAWLGGNGCVPINNLMEDAATAEISRAQLWQWVHHETGIREDGRNITYELFREYLDEESDAIRETTGAAAFAEGRYREALDLLDRLTRRDELTGFLTLEAYALID